MNSTNSRPSPTFQVGERFVLPVKRIVPFGLFFELRPGFQALLHRSELSACDLSTFSVGQVVSTRVIAIDSFGRVQLTLDSPNPSSAVIPCMSPAETVVKWRNDHLVQDAAAVAWLRYVTQMAPLHATLLSELKTRFGVPTPLSAWFRLHADVFVNLGPKNPYSGHPCAGLVSKLGDANYWRTPIRVVPPTGMSAVAPVEGVQRTAHQEAFKPQQTVAAAGRDGLKPTTPTLLIDGSNLIRTFPSGGAALAALLHELDRAGRRFQVVFDANIRYVLDERNDVSGRKLLSDFTDRITIVPAGSPADDYILLLADRKGFDVLSNDRYETFRVKFSWLTTRFESADRRLHTVAEIDRELVAPTLGFVIHI